MTIKTILVHFDIDTFSSELAAFAGNLSKKFDARLIGFAACGVQPAYVSIDGGLPPAELVSEMLQQIDEQLNDLEKRFRVITADTGAVEWRGFVEDPTTALCREARSADLIVTRSNPNASILYSAREVDQGDLILGAGRPILVAGDGVTTFKGDKILVGWKDTRESRRALRDALPFLKKAQQVIVTTLGDRSQSENQVMLSDVVTYLGQHGCKVTSEIHDDIGDGGERLQELATQMGADMVVTGAFGHHRLRERIFGGVTRSLLQASPMNRFMSN